MFRMKFNLSQCFSQSQQKNPQSKNHAVFFIVSELPPVNGMVNIYIMSGFKGENLKSDNIHSGLSLIQIAWKEW